MSLIDSYTLPGILREAATRYSDRPAYSYVGEKPVTYSEVWTTSQAIVSMLERSGVKKGDKIGLLSQNMPNWGIVYFSITSMGAIVVPLLPDFSKDEIKNVIDHSDMRQLFVSQSLLSKVDKDNIDKLGQVYQIEDFSAIKDNDVTYISGEKPENEYNVSDQETASIIYTSGTTGKPKGVMLSHKNICFTAIKGGGIQEINSEDRFLSVLPLSHTYENTLGLILPMLGGACVNYLKKPPTPAVLIPALKEVRPTTMLTVPLIIEKIYRNKVLPAFTSKSTTRMLYRIPFLRKRFNKLAGKKLMRTFGGSLKFFGIGGARLNKEVEKFLIEADFPYAIGYGLTETSPLLAGCGPHNTKLQSTGPKLDGIKLKINNPAKFTGEGEIWAKGPNVMQGYYKEPELTKQVLTDDGWFKTGDLGLFDEQGNLYIRGRSKNVIIGASGENIFPEDIESVINNFKHVAESLVIQQKGKLVALVHFNREEIESQFKHMQEEVSHVVDAKCEELKNELRTYVNEKVNKFSRIHLVEVVKEEFQKTATKKIKRFKYA